MQNNNITLRQARLQGREGLWQLTIENGRFSRIEPQDTATLPLGEVLDAEGGPPFHRSLSHISIWTPRKPQASRAGTSLVRYLKALSVGPNVRQCSRTKTSKRAPCRR